MRWRAYNAPPERLVRRVTLCASSSQAPSDATLCIRSTEPIALCKACALGVSRNTSSRRKRQGSSIALLVLSKMQTLALVCILVL